MRSTTRCFVFQTRVRVGVVGLGFALSLLILPMHASAQFDPLAHPPAPSSLVTQSWNTQGWNTPGWNTQGQGGDSTGPAAFSPTSSQPVYQSPFDGSQSGPSASDLHSPASALGFPGTSPLAIAPEPPKTAAEQGYHGDPAALAATLARVQADADQANSPRQHGDRLRVASVSVPSAADASSALWLEAWKQRLLGLGIAPSKVDFEAHRLSHDDFALWASRLVWALTPVPWSSEPPVDSPVTVIAGLRFPAPEGEQGSSSASSSISSESSDR